jgi:hypothetical protein
MGVSKLVGMLRNPILGHFSPSGGIHRDGRVQISRNASESNFRVLGRETRGEGQERGVGGGEGE